MNPTQLFSDASRVASKLRLALTGATNTGKTYSALLIAYGITKDWSKIAVIDSERRRALFYAERNDLPFPTGAFKHAPLDPPYDPKKYIDYIKAAEQLVGPDGVVIVDSFSHPWYYRGGVLDIKEEIASKKGKNSFTAWNEASRIQDELIDTVLSANCHIIVTMRSKMTYVLEQTSEGKQIVKKLGMQPIQRDDVEYEFDITLMLQNDHSAEIIKDTTFLGGKGYVIPPITPELGEQIVKWLNEGIDPKVFKEQERMNYINQIKQMGAENPNLVTLFKTKYPNKKTDQLSLEEAKEVIQLFQEVLK